jgi:hypothetical protein
VPPPDPTLEPVVPPIVPAPSYHENTRVEEAVPQTAALEDPPLTDASETSSSSSDEGIAPSTQFCNEPIPSEIRNSPVERTTMSATQTQTLAPVNTNFLASGSSNVPFRGAPPPRGPPDAPPQPEDPRQEHQEAQEDHQDTHLPDHHLPDHQLRHHPRNNPYQPDQGTPD